MIETDHGTYELVKNYRDAFVLDDFNNRYIKYLNQYRYIVGDYSAGMLRLKGFSVNGKETYQVIPDYISESCPYNCSYYILKRIKKNKQE